MIPLFFILFFTIPLHAQELFDCIVATVGEEAITKKELNRAEKMYGEKALEHLIEDFLIEQEARKKGKTKEELLTIILSSVCLEEEEIERIKESLKHQVYLLHILIKERKEAEEVKRKIDEGEEFEEVAKKHSLCSPYLGFVTKGALKKQLEEIAFSLKEGEVSEIIETDMGYHIIKCLKKRATPEIEFKNLLKIATTLVLEEKCAERKNAWVKELKEKYGVKVWRNQELQ